jgi:hypothetical protein
MKEKIEMKEKINEYVDGKKEDEELNELLQNEELREYYNDLLKMKEGLKELRVTSPDFVSKLEKVEKKRTILKFASVMVSVVVVVSCLFIFKDKLFVNNQVGVMTKNQEKSFKVENPSGPPLTLLNPQLASKAGTVKIEINGKDLPLLIDKLKTISTLVIEDPSSNTYTFEVESSNFGQFFKILDDFKVTIVEKNVPDALPEGTINIAITVIQK